MWSHSTENPPYLIFVAGVEGSYYLNQQIFKSRETLWLTLE